MKERSGTEALWNQCDPAFLRAIDYFNHPSSETRFAPNSLLFSKLNRIRLSKNVQVKVSECGLSM